MKAAQGPVDARDHARRWDAVIYRILLAVIFPLFLLTALAGRLKRRRSYFLSPARMRRRSVFVEAKALANMTIPHAFMGW